MQHRGDALGLPVREQRLHVVSAGIGTLDKKRVVVDSLLLLIDRAHVLAHRLAADLHIAHRVVAVGLSIAFPNPDRVRHQFAHSRLVVVVADNTAGDTGRTRADA